MKQKYPHLYEYFRLGRGKTQEGKNYYDDYWDKIRHEMVERHYVELERFLHIGENKKIHQIEKDER